MAATMATNTANKEDSGFSIVQQLAQELSSGRVDLPSFPDAAARVQQAVSDPDSTSERVARVVSSDAGLAAASSPWLTQRCCIAVATRSLT